MKKLIAIFVMLLAGLALFGQFPLVYNVNYQVSGNQVSCSYTLKDVPKTAVIVVKQPGADSLITKCASKLIDQDINDPTPGSISFACPGFDSTKAVLELNYKGKTYPEMVYMPAGRYYIPMGDQEELQYTLQPYWLSRRNVANHQYLQFMKDDGYETEKYWIIKPGLMKDTEIGWYYQGSRPLTKPYQWDTQAKPWYVNALYPADNDPVTGLTWFEAYAYCQWLGADIPQAGQLSVCFYLNVGNSYKIKQLKTTSGEWTVSGIDPTSGSCASCNEMCFLEKTGSGQHYPVIRYKCPLFRSPDLGFRIAVTQQNNR